MSEKFGVRQYLLPLRYRDWFFQANKIINEFVDRKVTCDSQDICKNIGKFKYNVNRYLLSR